MENVEFDEKASKNMHILSKAVYIITKIVTIICYIGVAFIALGLIIIPILLGHVDTKNSTFKVGGKEYSYKIDDKKLTVYDGAKEVVSEKIDIDIDLNEMIEKHPSSYYIGVAETVLGLGAVSIILVILFLKHLSKLFKNIGEDETPFTEENIFHLRKMALFLIIGVIFAVISDCLFSAIAGYNMRLNFSFSDILYILIILCASYVFSYGLKLEKPKKVSTKK